jgi:hypothetical protein
MRLIDIIKEVGWKSEAHSAGSSGGLGCAHPPYGALDDKEFDHGRHPRIARLIEGHPRP